MTSVRNHLSEIRQQRGHSAAELAARAGLTRQTIYAIEAGSYVPNTAAALRLAQVLGVSVEDLFHLDEPEPEPARDMEVDLLAEDPGPSSGQPVQLCRVGQHNVGVARSPFVWELPPADAFLLGPGKRARTARVRRFQESAPPKNRLVIAGCDPGMSVLARHVQKAGVDLVVAHANSSRALALLKTARIHIAGSHLRDETSGESNMPAVRKQFARGSVVVVNLAIWEEGIIVARGNPKGIRGLEDLARKDVLLVNREPGAGSRALLDAGLRRLGIGRGHVRGYHTLAHGHLPAAWQVHIASADCCIATRAAARVLGLDFVPLLRERYDLVVRKAFLALSPVQALLETLHRADFRRELEMLGDYDTRDAGKVMT